MRRWLALAVSAALSVFGSVASAQETTAPITDFPRNETMIAQNPEGVIRNPGWFNIWVQAGGGWSTGLQQLTMDTLWYIDPDAGINGAVYNSLATGPAEYSADFTEMTVHLREGVYWSDGVEFTSDDVVFTVEKQMAEPATNWSAAFTTQVESVDAPDKYTVHFKLKAPNSRFHAVFSVRWNACWIMPKHVLEGVENLAEYDFNPPVGLGPYTLHSFDPNGTWYIWERREDWQRTAMAEFGEPAPRYVIYRNNIPTDRRLIEIENDDLDLIHDLTPEGMFSLIEQDPDVRAWFPGFPYAHPDPTLPMVIFNNQNPLFQDKRVRWALALMLDIRAISMASYRGAATLSAIAIPPTGTHPHDYHAPMQEWLTNYELDTGSRKIHPYDPTIGLQIADMLRPQYGDQIPTDETAIRNAFGYGWWKQDLEAATELLQAAGFTKPGDTWLTPSGEPFSFGLNLWGENAVMNRLGSMVAQNWKDAGIDVQAANAEDLWPRNMSGDFDTVIAWSIETWGGHPDLSYFLDSWHSQFIAPPGQTQPPRNWGRWADPRLDAIIEQIRQIDFNDPKNVELGQEFVRLMVDEMPIIPIMSFNVFSAYSQRHWTGWPTAENPYANPVNNWSNSRYILTQLKPTGN